MTPEQFAYWLQGHVEMNPAQEMPTPEQWQMIKDHLKTVFVKVTPEIRVAPLEINRSSELRQADLIRDLSRYPSDLRITC